MELFEYQKEGVRFLVANASAGRGSLLADKMGLGKTVQTVAALSELWRLDRARFLVWTTLHTPFTAFHTCGLALASHFFVAPQSSHGLPVVGVLPSRSRHAAVRRGLN